MHYSWNVQLKRLIYSIVVFLLAACQTSRVVPNINLQPSPTTETADHTQVVEIEPLFSLNEDCPPPCWEGLIPGMSTRDEAWNVIHLPNFSEWSSDNNYASPSYLLLNQGDFQDIFSMIVISFDEDDTVESIQGAVDSKILVSEVISLLGPPAEIAPGRPISECTPCSERRYPELESDELIFFSFMLYPENGTYYKILLDDRDWGCVCPEMRLTWFCYLAPQPEEGLIEATVIVDSCPVLETSVEILDRAGPWQGYTIPN